ncbi:MAG: DUF3526 domain-containing protein [Bacteroidota bacterium]
MRRSILQLLSKHTFQNLLKSNSTKWLIGLFNVLLLFALLAAYSSSLEQAHTLDHYSQEVRERWESNPDKHPHRMAHYGYVAFRQKYPLSFFDYGMDSYLGNAVFLEAHRQNTINFSEASLSSSLLRFGEISAALILQLLVPLLLFFWGFSLIAKEREQGTLQLLLAQGTSWSELIIGKTLGLFYLSLMLLLPSVVVALGLLFFHPLFTETPDVVLSFGTLAMGYLIYLFIMSLLAVWISATCQTSKTALIQLIGCWLFFTLMLPKLAQVTGQVFYPSPSKIEFDTAVEEELIEQGDSHDPNDPHFKGLKDSLLAVYQVSSTDELPFNFSGYVMREGERMSTETFRRHQLQLMERYQQQQNLIRWTALINPYIAIKNLSMAMSGTDFLAYRNFQDQTEAYRYDLAQTMNELQIKYVSNNTSSSADKKSRISQQHWKDFPDFQYQFLSFKSIFQHEILSLFSLLLWLAGLLCLANFSTQNLKAF